MRRGGVQPRIQHRGPVRSQPPRPRATAVCRFAHRGEPDIVLSCERDEIACKVRVAQVTRVSHTPTLPTDGEGVIRDIASATTAPLYAGARRVIPNIVVLTTHSRVISHGPPERS
jgi:hypothetical protein